eukprot:3831762-Lingulodinium_polyedra.AAC.1
MFGLADVFVARREHLAAPVRRVQWRVLCIAEAAIRTHRGDDVVAGVSAAFERVGPARALAQPQVWRPVAASW